VAHETKYQFEVVKRLESNLTALFPGWEEGKQRAWEWGLQPSVVLV